MAPRRVHIDIPLAQSGSVLSWDQSDIDRLVERAVDLAVRVGLRLDEDSEGVYLREAEGKGARIDWEAQAAMFTHEQIADTVAVLRETSPAGTPLRGRAGPGEREGRFVVGNGANLLFDWDAWQVKAPGAVDLARVCHWAQGCDDVCGLFAPVMLKDMDLRLEPLYSYALMARHCRKPVYHEQPTEPIHVKCLDRMARVVEAHRGYFQPMSQYEYINPPFRISARAVRTMLARVDLGACDSMGIGPMTVGGMSAPVTVAGAAVVALAELLAGLTFFRILRPGFGLRATMCTGALDMRTARVSFFGMHAHLQNLAGWELLVRGLGVDASCLTWYRDANEPGMQALYEFGTAQAFFSSVVGRCSPEIGGLANGNIFSPHQAVLDIPLCREFDELTAGFEAGEDALGLDEVVKARFDQGLHMATEHTLEYMNDGVPFGDFLFRGLAAGAQHDGGRTQTDELMAKAEQSVRADTAEGEAVEPDEELATALYEQVEAAAAELGIEPPPLV